MKKIGIGLLGLGTVGQGVANIISNPNDRHPLVGELEIVGVAIRAVSYTHLTLPTTPYV